MTLDQNSEWLTRPGFTKNRCQMGQSDEGGLRARGQAKGHLVWAMIENAASNTR